MTAAERWASALQEWAIPEEILASASESPWGFPAEVFLEATRRALSEPPTPTHQLIAAALPPGGTLIDVGCGSGAASLPTAPPAGRIVGVDEDPAMLEVLATLAAGRVTVQTIEGRWPDIADHAGRADVVVCANVAYNVAQLGPFVEALTAAARRRVVLELTARHPQAHLNQLWKRFWGLDRPEHPTAEDALEVVAEVTGAIPEVRRWDRAGTVTGDHGPEALSWVRRRLCLPPGSEPEVAAALEELPEGQQQMVTLAWPGTGPDEA